MEGDEERICKLDRAQGPDSLALSVDRGGKFMPEIPRHSIRRLGGGLPAGI